VTFSQLLTHVIVVFAHRVVFTFHRVHAWHKDIREYRIIVYTGKRETDARGKHCWQRWTQAIIPGL